MCDIEELHRLHGFTPAEAESLRVSWLAWYDRGHRPMPWRNEASVAERAALGREERAQWAYRVWVSEVMLQQTQVERVIPYFERWMERFPTIKALADASIDDVRTVWSGLGYYRRAAFLLEGARQITGAGDGLPPVDAAGWGKVKGVGPYTAAAVTSIVYNKVIPVVDGNVIRVTARLRAVGANPKAPVSVKLWWRLATELVDETRPGDFNQAMMELGATLCSKAVPRCAECPLSAHCRAYAEAAAIKGADVGKEVASKYPAVAPKTAQREVDLAVCVLMRVPDELADRWRQLGAAGARTARGALQQQLWEQGELLLLKRPETGAGQNKKLLAGLWELPTAELQGEHEEGGEPPSAQLEEAVDVLLRAQGLVLGQAEIVCRQLVSLDGAGEARPIVQTFSHLKHRMLVEWLVVPLSSCAGAAGSGAAAGSSAGAEGCWLREADLGTKGASTGVAKAVESARAFAVVAPATTAKGQKRKPVVPVAPEKSISKFFKPNA
ncbi:DNA glycosylase [Pavlovales sp. CCMP2436]|nr:DNA glycosylase [Pavlovales sp. CCMP2436]